MKPEELFHRYSPQARELVTKLVWHYQSSGALQYQDEAHSEGQLALWQLCQRFNPHKQELQVKKERKRRAELMHSLMFDFNPPESNPIDPYANFWMFATMRVRGGVIDYFRSQKLILKRSLPGELRFLDKEQLRDIKNRMSRREELKDIAELYKVSPKSLEELKPTMFYRDRFVSLDRSLSDFSNEQSSGGYSFCDVMPAPDVTKQREEQAHLAYLISMAIEDAELSKLEQGILMRYFSEDSPKPSKVAKEFGVTVPVMDQVLNQTLCKIRQQWPENIRIPMSQQRQVHV